ncbi:MAG: hypothetical protein L0H15_03885 [Nitrosospira sp.]|nr:hypothetical protein [Nitrosospira sp.]MDN5882477.1 hypothetical protein [Nitrosospira sp.]MDN5936627.1 hypothetical protein [Nitrosospira sp.]
MKYLAAVIFLASCAMLAPIQERDRVIEQPVPVNPKGYSEVNPEVDSAQSERRPETREPELEPSHLAVSPVSEVSSCAYLDAGDLKETIKAKLDCITDNAK